MSASNLFRRGPIGPLAIAAAFACAHPGRAAADDDRASLENELVQFVIAAEYAAEDGPDASQFERPASACTDVVTALTKAGAKPTDMIEGSRTFPFKQAGAKCAAYAGWKAIADAMPAVTEAAEALATTPSITVGWGDESFDTKFGAFAAACAAGVDKALAAGAPKDKAVRVRDGREDRQLTLPAIRTDICDKLATWAKEFGPATRKAKEAQAAAAKLRYSQFGAAGDRLEWLSYYDPEAKGHTWYIPGCKPLDDPKKLVKAPVLLQWWTADDGQVTIRRFQFKGNKLVKDSSRTFLTEASASASRCK